MARSSTTRCCPNPACSQCGVRGGDNIAPHGSLHTRHGRRRRWICNSCGTSLSTNTGTPYLRIHSPRRAFDHVADLRVEGLSISAIARVTGHGWNKVARWLQRAGVAAGKFNNAKIKGFELIELQPSSTVVSVVGLPDRALRSAAHEACDLSPWGAWLRTDVGRGLVPRRGPESRHGRGQAPAPREPALGPTPSPAIGDHRQ